MRRRLAVSSAVVVLALAFAVPIAVQAGLVHEWSNDAARSWFSATDVDGTRMVIYVDARSLFDQQPPDVLTETSRVYISIYGLNADGSRGPAIAAGGADLAPGEFEVNGPARSADLDCFVEDLYSFAAGTSDVDVAAAVKWRPTGRPEVDKTTYNELYPWGREIGGLTIAFAQARTDNSITIGTGPSMTRLDGIGWMRSRDGSVSTVGPPH